MRELSVNVFACCQNMASCLPSRAGYGPGLCYHMVAVCVG